LIQYYLSMVDKLFGSKTRVKLLGLFLSNPNRPFYVREITRKIDEQINSVRRELANLLSIGVITSDTSHNKLYYEVNQKYEFFDALSVIFSKIVARDTIEPSTAHPMQRRESRVAIHGLIEQIDEITNLGNVELAVFTGQFTRDESCGIDLLVVGDVNKTKLQKFIAVLETRESKEVRYTVMTSSQFDYRRQVKDRFVSNLFLAKKQIVIDRQNVFGRVK
jgi:hypothetical protein